ncbi:MAG TPA: xylose isomerase [Anaerolinea thermolimosa]|uniref:Xylose isomerase n=1 Tax=Anaerolinea thermolimosa TaxID=229919 RepID=A0A3D1JG65_9CHLR|nr:xylose isomerase [Anaerolinea thermolimosa]
MNLSVASYSFHGLLDRGMIDLFGYLESCRYRYHLHTADIWNGMISTLDEDFLKKVKEGLQERELTLVNLCVDGPHIWEDDPALREKHYQEALAYLRAAEFLGAKTLRIDAGGQGESFNSEQFDLIVTRYREYAQWAYDHGFKVGPENHWGPEAVPENMKKICEAVNHPGFGVLLHFRGNAGDALMAPWAMHTHISWDIVHRCLDESMSMLRAAGYQGCWSVEHHSGSQEYVEVAIQLASVRRLLEKWAE